MSRVKVMEMEKVKKKLRHVEGNVAALHFFGWLFTQKRNLSLDPSINSERKRRKQGKRKWFDFNFLLIIFFSYYFCFCCLFSQTHPCLHHRTEFSIV